MWKFCCVLFLMVVGVSFAARANEGNPAGKLDAADGKILETCQTDAYSGSHAIEPMYRSGMTKRQIYMSLGAIFRGQLKPKMLYDLADHFATQPLMSNIDAYGQVMEACLHDLDFKYPEGVEKSDFWQISKSYSFPQVYALGNQTSFPLNMFLSTLVLFYPGADCFDWRDGKTCEVKSDSDPHLGFEPIIGLKPPFTAHFRGLDNEHDRLSGFTQEKKASDWENIYDLTTAVYGAPKIEDHPAGAGMPMSSTIYKWELKLGEFSMIKFGGQDVYGSPIDKHEIGFEEYPLPDPGD